MIRTILLVLLLPMLSIGQNIDSLKVVLKNAKHDTTRCSILGILTETTNDKEWPGFNLQMKEIALINLKNNSSNIKLFKKYLASALNNQGYLNDVKGDSKKAFLYYDSSLKIFTDLGSRENVSTILTNIGNLHANQGNIKEALEYALKALKTQEELGLEKGMAATLNNIGVIYSTQKEYKKALECYEKSLAIELKNKNKSGVSSSYLNIGSFYQNQKNMSLALKYLKLALKSSEEIGDKEGCANSLINMAEIYFEYGDPLIISSKEKSMEEGFTKAIEYYNRGLIYSTEIGYKKGVVVILTELAELSLIKNKKIEALNYAKGAMKIATKIGYPSSILNSAVILKLIYKSQNNYKQAFEMYELELQMRDSINNIETQKSTFKLQTEFEYQKKKEIADNKHSIELSKQKEIAIEKQKKQNAIILSVLIGFLCVSVLSFYIFRNLKLVSKQKILIEQKSNEVEEKQKEILDSINYAERIQRSFLASKEVLKEHLKEHFILFQPKDIVSGDFYWASKLKNNNFALTIADSTGHGVPGAIMSLLNITSLEKAVETESEPAEILNITRKIIIERLKNDGSKDGGKDGMDASLLCFDFKNLSFQYASANNPIWVIRKSDKTPIKELIELKPDKMPIGKHEKDTISFSQHQFNLMPGDMIYTFTDGIADQFGGPKGKKFMYKQLKELLLSISAEPMVVQKNKLEDAVLLWKGKLEQVDDITILGLRV